MTSGSFAAAWVVGSVAALTGDHVASLNYFRVSELDGTAAGEALSELARLSGRPVLAIESEFDSLIDLGAYAVSIDRGIRLFLSNLSRRVRVESPIDEELSFHLRPWSYEILTLAAGLS